MARNPNGPKCERCGQYDECNVGKAANRIASTFRATCPGCKRKVYPCCTTTGHTGKGSYCVDCKGPQ
jgi:hypothetical protein